MRNYSDGPCLDLGVYVNKDSSFWIEVWTGTWRSSKRFWFSGVRDLGNFRVFEVLGGAGDINNSVSMTNYCDGPCLDLGVYVNKDSSFWIEVWTGTWRSSKRLLLSGVVLGIFSSF